MVLQLFIKDLMFYQVVLNHRSHTKGLDNVKMRLIIILPIDLLKTRWFKQRRIKINYKNRNMDLQAVLNDLKIDTITNFLIMEEKTLKT